MTKSDIDVNALSGYAKQLGLTIEPDRLQGLCEEVLLVLNRVRGLDAIDVSEIPLEAAAPTEQGSST